LLCAAVAFSQSEEKRVSPHETVTAILAKKTISITYGRPSVKGRKIFGGLVPFDQVWRTGADEATELNTEAMLDIRGLTVPPGRYSLYTLPGEKKFLLIVNKQTGQSGMDYDKSQDLGRVEMDIMQTPPMEQLAIAFLDVIGGKAVLHIGWENTQVSVPIAVK
jgi:hypothetical protein